MDEKDASIKIFIRRLRLFRDFLRAGVRATFASSYWKNRTVSRVNTLSFTLNLIIWIYLLLERIPGGMPMILHYNLFVGVDVVGEYDRLFLLPAVGLLLFATNTILGHYFYRIERLATYLLALNTLIIQVFLLLASYLIIRVNA